MAQKMIKGVVIGTASALALAAAGQASAVTMQAGNTELQVYGYAILKASYDFDENLGSAVAGLFDNVVDNQTDSGYFDMDARQSRLGFATSTDTDMGTVKTRFEGDMLGAGGQGAFRLRHAYGEWNGILAGKTWSNFNTFTGVTPTIDFDGNVGDPGTQFRNAQIRYTTGGFSVALEEAHAALTDSVLGAPSPASSTGSGGIGNVKHSLPDLSAKYEGQAGNFSYAAGAAVQRIESTVDGGETATGGAGFLAGSFALGDTTTLNATASYSDGFGMYLSDAPAAYYNGSSFETVKVKGGTVGISQKLGMGSLNATYGIAKVDDAEKINAATGSSVQDKRQNFFLNYMWSPVENVTYGVEYGYFKVDPVSGDSQSANRISFASQFNF